MPASNSAAQAGRFVTNSALLVKTAQRNSVITQSASGAASAGGDASPVEPSSFSWWKLIGSLLIMTAATVAVASTGQATAMKDYLVNGPLGKSGFLAAFSLVFLSEIGDKTFFIAALLAMRLGKWVSFFGSLAALAVMTAISVGIGVVFSRVPDALKSSVPVGELCGVALLVFFGYKSLRAAFKADDDGSDDELADAEDAVKEVESSRSRRSVLKSLIEVASLVFVAEWGDRSMLATIGLAASQSPWGVCVGAIAGHAIATGIAVFCGVVASKFISEKTINLVSGVLFLVFAVATVYSMF